MTDAADRWHDLDRLLDRVLDGLHTAEDATRLNQILRADADACRHYVSYLQLHGRLCWGERGLGTSQLRGLGTSVPSEAGSGEGSGFGVQEVAKSEVPNQEILDPSSFTRHPSDAPDSEPLIPPIIIDTSPALPSSVFSSSLGGWLLSYGIATVLMAAAVLGAWVYTVSHDNQLAGADNSRELRAPGNAGLGTVSPRLEEPESVGRITGIADCRWANPETAPEAAAPVPLARKYELVSGLLEITYDTGAKVILQGPCTYEIESATGGFLSLGKLTARVENAVPQSPNPKSQILNPKFVVRTPTAVVTDLGTEFGVEVTREGDTDTQVFQGNIRVVTGAGGDGVTADRVCHEGEAVRVDRKRTGIRTITPEQNAAGRFVRAVPPPQAVRDSQAYAGLVLSLNPAVYYRMERPGAGQDRYVVFDSAAGGRHGELRLADPSGLPYVSGRFGDALWFCGPEMSDRIGDRVLVHDYPKAANDRLTVSAWVMAVGRPESAMIASNWGIPDREHENTGQFQLCLYRDEGDLAAYVTQRDGQRVEVREGHDSPLPLHVWQHVALVADGTTLHLYRNGKEVASGPCAGVLPDPPLASLGIGCRTNKANTDAHPAVGQYAWFWRGGIDELAVFNRALPPQTIERLCSGNSPPVGEAKQALKKGAVPMNGP